MREDQFTLLDVGLHDPNRTSSMLDPNLMGDFGPPVSAVAAPAVLTLTDLIHSNSLCDAIGSSSVASIVSPWRAASGLEGPGFGIGIGAIPMPNLIDLPNSPLCDLLKPTDLTVPPLYRDPLADLCQATGAPAVLTLTDLIHSNSICDAMRSSSMASLVSPCTAGSVLDDRGLGIGAIPMPNLIDLPSSPLCDALANATAHWPISQWSGLDVKPADDLCRVAELPSLTHSLYISPGIFPALPRFSANLDPYPPSGNYTLEHEDVYSVLDNWHADYSRMWAGAHLALISGNPDGARQAAHSARELLRHVLEELAPTDILKSFDWARGRRGEVTFRARARYALSNLCDTEAEMINGFATGCQKMFGHLSGTAKSRSISHTDAMEVRCLLDLEGALIKYVAFKAGRLF